MREHPIVPKRAAKESVRYQYLGYPGRKALAGQRRHGGDQGTWPKQVHVSLKEKPKIILKGPDESPGPRGCWRIGFTLLDH